MELPKKCNECGVSCGGRDLPAAWAVYDGKDSYWLCDKHYWKAFPPEKVYVDKFSIH